MQAYQQVKLIKLFLVGGSTRIPAVQEAIKKYTGKEPSKGVNPDEVCCSRCSNSSWCFN